MRTYDEFEEFRSVRRGTLALVENLDQRQSEAQAEEGLWSVGQVLDHLVKLDVLIVRELDVALGQKQRGLPFVYRGIADIDSTIPWVLRPVLPFFEVPFSFFNVVVPAGARRAITGNRSLPLQAPGSLKPRPGRSLETLRTELESALETFEEQQRDHPTVDLRKLYYYNPITGLGSIPSLYRFVSNHEKRHQAQLHDILDHPGFPS